MATPFARTTRALQADNARTAWWAWGLALLLGAAWAGWFAFGRVTVLELSQSARLEVQRAAHAVAAATGGAVLRSHLAIGRDVKAGDLLLELDDRVSRLRLAESTARLAGLPARQAALRDEIAALDAARAADQAATAAGAQAALARSGEAAAQLAFARDHERRLNAELASGSVAEIDALRARAETLRQAAARDALVADARRSVLEAGGRAQQLRARVDALRGQLLVLDNDAATLRAGIERLHAEIERLRVRAPVDGSLGDVAVLGPGSVVAEGQKLAVVLPRGSLRVVAAFRPATALGRLHPGQRAQVRLDGFPWAQHGSVNARVQQVAGEVHDDALRVELALEDGTLPPAVLQHGLTGRVEVTLESVSPAVLLLRAAGQKLSGAAT
jgi:membrane fusion protein, adhesin transport system